MELRQLSHFVAVADEGSFTAAARALHLSQPGVSASVAALEKEFGTRLITRRRRHAELTDAGRVVYAGARRALAGLDDLRVRVTSSAAPAEPVRIGAIPSVPSLHLAALVSRFTAANPGSSVHVDVGFPESLLRAVADGSLELAFLTLPDEHPEAVDVTPVSAFPMVLACPPGHRLARRDAVGVRDLAEEDFVDFTPALDARRVTDDAFANAGISRTVRATCDEIASLLELVAHGVGLAIVPRPLATATRVPIAVVSMTDPTLVWTLAVATHAGGATTPSARAFHRMLSDTVMG